MNRLRVGLLGVGLALLLGACGSSEDTVVPTEGPGGQGGGSGLGCDPPCVDPQFCSTAGVCLDPGTCLAEDDCGPGLTCDEQGQCVPGGNCGGQEVAIDPVVPNLLIVLDRSCSMRDEVAGTPKWTIAVEAIEKMTTTYEGQIRFGLTLFPDTVDPACTQGQFEVHVGDGNEAVIQSTLTASLLQSDPNYPDGPCVTNIDTAMQQAADDEPELDDPTRDSFVLLLTDGAQYGCSAAGSDAGTTAIITDLCQTRNVSTFVVGFGGQVDAAQLNIFADAGCVPTGDPQTSYYQAEDQPSLDAVLDAIANKTLSCTIALESEPENPDDIYVFFDNDTTPIPQDPSHAGGWDYDPDNNQITFYGAECEQLKAGEVTDVDVVFGCASTPQ